jgi:hypothetical protein
VYYALQAFYSIRSERELMELEFDLLSNLHDEDFSSIMLSFVWALHNGERSSRVKTADRGFASRQSASLVPIKRGKLRTLLP